MNDRGGLADEVTLRVNNEEDTFRCLEYDVNVSIFRQPAAFNVKIGAPNVRELLERHKPEMPFEIRLKHRASPGDEPDKDVVLQSGRLDTVEVSEGGGTTLSYSGRDSMRELFKSYFKADTSYSEKSYYDLVLAQLKAVGFTEEDLQSGETAREKMAVTGTQTRAPRAAVPSVDGTTQVIEQVESGQTRVVYNTITGNAGEQRYAWIKAQLARAGLFLWCGPAGWFLLSSPNATQEPAYEVLRNAHGMGNAKLVRFRNDTTNRHWRVEVMGRAGGGKDGQRQVTGRYDDPEMERYIQQFGAKRTVRYDIDEQIRTSAEAEYKARRLAAEERRAGWSLEYQFSGHTMPALHHPGKRTVPLPNFCVRVKDERIGIDTTAGGEVGDVLWTGDVTFSRRGEGSGTTVNTVLYRPADLIFALENS